MLQSVDTRLTDLVLTRVHYEKLSLTNVVHTHAALHGPLRLLLRLEHNQDGFGRDKLSFRNLVCPLKTVALALEGDGFGRANLSFRSLVLPLETIALALEARDLLPRIIKYVEINAVLRASSAITCNSTRHDSY
jgi:hypothetical protein